ncbi:hypothetical protein [Paracoccus sp. Z118]|uniref:hypothetical protein n=1 Tax=Paracoccus sp. Z118 TaxID=2851017 RepID=UPI0020B79649|nr:hypothetical protein [Paracoccus sp. Z118]
MRRFASIAGGLAAITLLTAAAAAAQQAPLHDPMAAMREAPAYNALQPGAVPAPEAPAAEAPAPAPVYDPMRAVTQPQVAAAGTDVAEGSPNPELGGLPDGPGAEETYYQCVACHSTAIIRQQRVTDARWDYLWRWMIEDQGMIPPDEETAEIIMSYLKQHFSSER